MGTPKASLWTGAPEPGIPEPPAVISDSDNLWLAYFRAADNQVAIVHFQGVIDHQLSSISDEGLGRHRYAKAGLKFYSFHELMQTQETQQWAALNARHWVITFKDNSLNVVAKSVEVITTGIEAASPLEALLTLLTTRKT